MPEEFDIGGPGIDTQYEREHINYRPKIKYTPPLIDSTHGLSADTASQESQLDEIGDTSIISLWEDVVEVVQAIDKVETTLSEKLQNMNAPIASYYKDKIVSAADKLGYKITDSIPFDLYKKSFDFPDTPEASLIQDAYEDYMADVQGTLNGELYTDIIEIKKDWEDMLEFIKRGLFAQVVSVDNVPKEVSTEDSNLEAVKAAEEDMRDEYGELLRMQVVNKALVDALSESEYGSERYYEALQELETGNRQIVNIEKKLFTKAEVVDLVQRKASDTEDNVSFISGAIDYDPYAEDKYEILYGLIKQFDSKEAMETGLLKVQAVLKLAVDGKKLDTNASKSTLRGIASRSSKVKINQNLVNGVHLRNEIYTDVYDIMSNLDGIPTVKNFEVIANHIVDGANEAEGLYKAQSSDFYKVHAMDTEVRSNKLGALIEKDATRSSYKLIGGLLDYSTKINTVWPSEDQLSGWLNNYMEYSKLT